MYTTDRGGNIICALQSEQRIDCIAHVINTVLRHTFDDKKMCPLPVSLLISTAKSLVRYIKKSSLQNLLPKGFKQSCETRWNSTFLMLQSVLQQYDDVQEVLQEHSPTEMRRLIGIDKELLGEIVNFLSVFHEATVALKGESEPTIHLVVPLIKKLTRHCQTTDDDSDNVATLKNACVDLIEEKCHIHILHKVAVFLNPRQKSMKVLQPQEREAVIAYVNDVIDDMPLRPGTTTLTDSQPNQNALDSIL